MKSLDDLFQDFTQGFSHRRFTAGLLVAFIDFLVELEVPQMNLSNLDDFFRHFPRQQHTAQGKRANTLIVSARGKTLSIRPFYNAAEDYFRSGQKRFDYPSCAPHATQAWPDYLRWLELLVTLDARRLSDLKARVCEYVLQVLPSQDFDPASKDVEPPLLKRILEEFDVTSRQGEPTGAAFQGIVFGFLRADNPHLQVEISKVRTGSKRLKRVGDVDGWEGVRLAISAEVKQMTISCRQLSSFDAFANETARRGALGLVIALEFEPGVREHLAGLGLKALDVEDLRRIVELWDPMKQRIAVMSFVYYAEHVEMNSQLSARLRQFLDEVKGRVTPDPWARP